MNRIAVLDMTGVYRADGSAGECARGGAADAESGHAGGRSADAESGHAGGSSAGSGSGREDGCSARENRERRQLTDLSDIRGTNFFCDEKAAAELRERLAGVPASGIHRIDSGDCHYLTLFFLEKIRRPFRLLLMDHHTDMQESVFGSGLLTCGSWALRSLERLPFCRGAVLLGPEEGGIPGQLPEGKSFLLVRESEAAAREEEWKQALAAGGLPFYLSFDRDLLSPEEFSTDWSQGNLTAGESLDWIRKACGVSRLIGCDLCGEALPDAAAGILARNRAVTERMEREILPLLTFGI
ncbi:MAG: hypothetical protein ACOX8B_06935 [Lachnospiraceae bacterium]|jgi:hypothetical protein